jgi:voltage-gated potassium channel
MGANEGEKLGWAKEAETEYKTPRPISKIRRPVGRWVSRTNVVVAGEAGWTAVRQARHAGHTLESAVMTWLRSYFHCKFVALLGVLVLVFLLRVAHRRFDWPANIVESTGVLVLLPAILSLLDDRRLRLVALATGIPVLVVVLASNLVPMEGLHLPRIIARILSAAYMVLVVFAILRRLVTTVEVTVDDLVGAFVGYLMVGVLFAELYCVALMIEPQAISAPADQSVPQVSNVLESLDTVNDRHAAIQRWDLAQYFSFVTLTTVGYGDLHPRTSLSRLLAVSEAITGQFYLAVMVAGLVGVAASQHQVRRQHDFARRTGGHASPDPTGQPPA